MISDCKQIENLFKEIDAKLIKKVNVYIIGGAALLFDGLKPSTKDIDLIVDNTNEFGTFQQALSSLLFKEIVPTADYKKMHLDKIMIRDDYRIDTFLKNVCKKFELSKDMMNRSKILFCLQNMNVYKCSNEDIFLFKSLMDRPGDLDDCIELIKKGLNWKVITKELNNQIKNSGQDVWITWVGERLDELIAKGMTIPIMKDINTMRNEFFEKLEKSQTKK